MKLETVLIGLGALFLLSRKPGPGPGPVVGPVSNVRIYAERPECAGFSTHTLIGFDLNGRPQSACWGELNPVENRGGAGLPGISDVLPFLKVI